MENSVREVKSETKDGREGEKRRSQMQFRMPDTKGRQPLAGAFIQESREIAIRNVNVDL